MSKVYSFRLSDDNPREAQAREVIKAWVEEGYSLRYVIVEALISHEKEGRQNELSAFVEKLQDLIVAMDRNPLPNGSNASLSDSFLNAVRQSAKQGVKRREVP